MPATASSSDRFWDSALLILLYTAFGPPLGALVLLLGMSLFEGPPGGFREWAAALYLMARFSYFFGGPPALLCGLVAAWVRWRNSTISVARMALIGRGASFLFALSWNGFNDIVRPDGGSVLLGILIFACVGAASAAICRRLGRKLLGPSP